MEVIKLKTPKGKNVEIPLSEKEADIEKPRLTIIKNGKKLYAPLVKEKPKNKEEFIVVRTTDGINYYVGESKKKDTSKITKYIGRDKGREISDEDINITGMFKVPEAVHILKLSIGDNFLTYFKVNPEQNLLFLLYGKGMEGTTQYFLKRLFLNLKNQTKLIEKLSNKIFFYQGEALEIECNGDIEKYVGNDIIDIRYLTPIKDSEAFIKYGFDKVDNSGSGVSVIGSEVEENPDDYDG